ncbi:MAG: substrate-binding domain-containing protein [Caldilineaceae bacterium]|nr:substrate-binding domain-containing protein [Caldilineaceae bacterium]
MEQNRKITIQDIAEKAKVSKSTVSRVLTSTARVADDKRAAVLKAMDELNYRPNIFARGLASGQSLTIGVLTQNFGSPFFDAILRGILQGLNGSSYSAIFTDGRWQAEMEEEALRTLLGRQVDGVIVVGGFSPGATLARVGEQAPIIVVGRRIAELADRCIWVDNYQAAYDVTRYLLDAGHRRIAHIAGTLSHEDAVARRDGYMRALQDAGIAVNRALIVEGDFRSHSGLMAVEMLFTRGEPFSAIFAANDQMAVGARLALHRRGIRVPQDVALVGFDNQVDSAYMVPPLTTVNQPAVEMGEAAARAMLQLLKHQPVQLPVFRTELVIRESVVRLQ